MNFRILPVQLQYYYGFVSSAVQKNNNDRKFSRFKEKYFALKVLALSVKDLLKSMHSGNHFHGGEKKNP